MSLVRIGIVLAAVVALLPSDPVKQQQLVASAADLARQAATYCERNPETCDKAAEAWEGLKEKAHFAAGLAIEILVEHGQLSGQDIKAAVPRASDNRGTLQPADLEPQWRAAPRRQGA